MELLKKITARPNNQALHDFNMSNKPRRFSSSRDIKFSIPLPTFSMPKIPRLGRRGLVFLTYIATFGLVGLLFTLFAGIVVVAYYSRELPNPNQLLQRSEELSTKILDRNGKLIWEVYTNKNRDLITYDKVSPYLVEATLSTEDAEFYTHQGFSLRGMVRAMRNTFTGEGLQGGSTLTQQVVKNALLTQDRNLSRKIKEFILSLQLENKYTKNEIIQMYLNETPYGGQNYGIITAARAYFNKEPSQLSLAEAAYLAGLPQRPSYYSHFGSNPEAGLERKNYVLYLMNNVGWMGEDGKRYYISDEEYTNAKNEDLKFEAPIVPFKAPHFVFYVRQLLADKFGEEMIDHGLQVTTSLDLDLQTKAEEIVADEVEKAARLNVGNGGLVALDPKTGQVLAMVGSKGYFLKSEPEGCISGITGENSCTFEPNLNVTMAKRQPGSSIKPITYAAMLSQGYTAAFPFVDVQTKFPGATPEKPYIPENYDGLFRGPVLLRNALGNSLNIPAVKALKIVGIDNMIDLAEKMGIKTLNDRSRYGLALTLGGGETKLFEMASAFSTFANKGVHKDPVAILEVKDGAGRLLFKNNDVTSPRTIGEDIAFLISDILSDDGARAGAFGAGSLLNIPGYQVAVKTGTTDDKRDNYAIGYTPSITVGVWVGNNNNDKMNPILASGVTGATPIWNAFMKAYLVGKEKERFLPPVNIKKFEVDRLTGGLPYEDYERKTEWFIVGTEPTAKSPWYQKLEICKPDGKIASDACREADETKVKTFIKITAEVPEWQSYVDEWVRKKYGDDDTYFPPTTTSRLTFDSSGSIKDSAPSVDFVGFKNGDTAPLEFRLQVEVSSDKQIRAVRIYKDGKLMTEDKSVPYGYNFSFVPSESGTHTFKAVAEDKEGNKQDNTIDLVVSGGSTPVTVTE